MVAIRLPLFVLGCLPLLVLVTCEETAPPSVADIVIKQLTRQLMIQQFYIEEKTRSDGDSGVKQVRVNRDGTAPYHVASHSGNSMIAMHDHSDFLNTVGLGEFIAVLNGLEFRTRHNDYKLKRRSTTSGEYNALEDIPFPPVPQAVLDMPNVMMQAAELRNWFRAWQSGNFSERDYRNYFYPILCYLEGAWTTEVDDLEEPFDSDRHQIAADSWHELLENVRFTSYTGDKDNLENYAFLPTAVMNITDDGLPVFAQWNYKILCHKIEGLDFGLQHLKPVDNLARRLANPWTFDKYLSTRAARFTITDREKDGFFPRWHLLDEIMRQIPGSNNYVADITDDTYDLVKKDVYTGDVLNTGFYHRWYKLSQKGAMGESYATRGFSDRNLFVAETTQPQVFPAYAKRCVFPHRPKRKTCTLTSRRMTYAIPLEVVWLTPLSSWNPYGLEYKGDPNSDLGKTVETNGRNGGQTKSTAYDGTNRRKYFITPYEFYLGSGEVNSSPADTAKKAVGVLDPQGNVKLVKSAGVRGFLPEIPGVGVVRTRYPVTPVHAEGSTAWKEIEALREVVMDMGKYAPYFRASPPFQPGDSGFVTEKPEPYIYLHLATSLSDSDPVGIHQHFVEFQKYQWRQMFQNGKYLTIITSRANGHEHTLTVFWNQEKERYEIETCDGQKDCWDGHSRVMSVVDPEDAM